MKKLLITILSIILAIVVIPLLIPVPPIEGLVDPKTLMDEDSKYIEIQGVEIHYKDMGEGTDTYILLHGFGASTYSYRDLQPYLSQTSRVISYDRPGFGLSQRPLEWDTFNPYTPEAQIQILIELMDKLEVENAILVGHSAGGLVAVNTALEHPERIQEMILIAPAIYQSHNTPQWLKPLLNTPQMNKMGILLARSISRNGERILNNAFYDPTVVTEEIKNEYKKPLQVKDWDKALWIITKSTYSLNTQERLEELDIPVLIVTGDTDTIVKTEYSIKLAQEIPNARLEIMEECGHIPHEEKFEEFIKLAF